jgi:serine/threonine protein kinase
VDYWALGCLIYELIYARTPFADDYHTKVFKKIVASEKTLQFPAGADPKHVALVKKLLAQNPSFRMGNLSNGIADLTGDPYFAEIDWDAITSGNVKAPFVPNVKNPLDASNFDQYEEDDHIPRFTGDQGLFTDF